MFTITSFYRFIDLKDRDLDELAGNLRSFAAVDSLQGLVLIAKEGLNGTVSGSADGMKNLKAFLLSSVLPADQIFKDSTAAKNPFSRFKVDIRSEIVSLFNDRLDVTKQADSKSYLEADEWQRVLSENSQDTLLIDVRNSYETRLGMFNGALDPQLNVFSEFPAYVQRAQIPKEKKVLMYCTGGIRCEKAALVMKEVGYKSVYQLNGGILKYLEEFPQQYFSGECFVFDQRVAVDQNLQPSMRYGLCPHCGDPAEKIISCSYCGKEKRICEKCLSKYSQPTCSKNCRYHAALGQRKSTFAPPDPK